MTCYIDASYGVHADRKCHTGCAITLGDGTIYAKSATQKLNTKSSTEAELVGLSDASNQPIWTRHFLIDQEYQDKPAIIYQDNKSTIQLISNGQSNSECTRHVDIRYFYSHDRIKLGEVKIEYKLTNDMLTDMLTKPLQGEQFRTQRNKVLNINWVLPSVIILLPTLFQNLTYYFGQHQPYVFYALFCLNLFFRPIPSTLQNHPPRREHLRRVR